MWLRGERRRSLPLFRDRGGECDGRAGKAGRATRVWGKEGCGQRAGWRNITSAVDCAERGKYRERERELG